MFSSQFDVLKVIGGTNGRNQGTAVLQAICECLFESEFMNTITWTGKSSSKSNKKLPMKSYKGVVKLITDLCVAADHDYSEKKCENDLIYKVFKYAYRKKTRNSDIHDNDSSSVDSGQSANSDQNIMQSVSPLVPPSDENTAPEEIRNEGTQVIPVVSSDCNTAQQQKLISHSTSPHMALPLPPHMFPPQPQVGMGLVQQPYQPHYTPYYQQHPYSQYTPHYQPQYNKYQ